VALNVVALAGGVGGAKLADGLARVLPAEGLTVVVNTGDDFDHLGLRICPDLDTVVYTLGGVAHPKTGWGRRRETWNLLETVGQLGGPTWFHLGDRDTALHVLRTLRLREGQPLSRIVRDVCARLGVGPLVLPMTDEEVATVVLTDQGEMPFQEYFVRRACQPAVRGFRFAGIDRARPAPGVLEALASANLVVLCPSNPWVSLDPILALPGIREALAGRPVMAVSPFIRGKAVKGPAAKMAAELGVECTPRAVAEHYAALLDGLVYDHADGDATEAVAGLKVRSLPTRTLMRTERDRARLASEVIQFGVGLAEPEPA
jgi:LPPG:FO 2-phospho-L-lactate transferase